MAHLYKDLPDLPPKGNPPIKPTLSKPVTIDESIRPNQLLIDLGICIGLVLLGFVFLEWLWAL